MQEKTINFYQSSERFPAVSLTGPRCELNCRHCARTLIGRLHSADTNQKLLEYAKKLSEREGIGMLLTGGCTKDGKVPVYEFLDAIETIKNETGLILMAHTGIAGKEEAKAITRAGLDGVCIDVVGSPKTTEEIYGISIQPEEYEETLKAFESAGMKNISPHVCVGLHNGRIFHEEAALRIISSIKPTCVVVIGLMNLSGTPMENVHIRAQDVLSILEKSKDMFPDSYISLGCARGTGKVREEIDVLAVRAGVDNIAVPTSAAYSEAKKLGLRIKEYSACCSVTPKMMEALK